MKQKITIPEFKKVKQEGRKLTMVTAFDYYTATIVDESEAEVILVGDSLGMIMLGYKSTTPVTMDEMIHHTKAVVKGAPNTFIIGDLPFGSYHESCEQAVRNSARMIKETGCDCVKLEGGIEMADRVRAIANAGIAVMGHIGLTPQTATNLGGYKVQGGTPESAKKLVEDAKILEQAGSFVIATECIPSGVTKAISEAVSVPVMGIGTGPYVDIQALLTHDLLGMYGGLKPKFVKVYKNLRKEMIEGINEFKGEVDKGLFPTPEYSFNAKVEGFEL
ncbi:MAG: 3-methyl-2-oxobutanoate hydroxymethyltransferase [Eubacteriaceae bacterium]